MDSEDIDDRSPHPYPTRSAIKGACCGGADDGTDHLSYVYALGRIEPRFPYPSVEKELVQAIGRAATAGLTDPQVLHAVLSERQNRYLVRQLCWVLTIEGLETYILKPRDPLDYDLLVAAVRPAPSPMDIDAVIGVPGPIAPPELCNGLTVPIVFFDQIYSFDREALIDSFPVAGDLESIREWITPNENGLLFDANVPSSIADAIITAIENKNLRNKAAGLNRAIISARAEYQQNMQRAEEFYGELVK